MREDFDLPRNVAKPSHVELLLSTAPNAENRKHIEQSAAALYAGGADSRAAGLSFLFLAMTVFPEVEVKAREGISCVVGAGWRPGF